MSNKIAELKKQIEALQAQVGAEDTKARNAFLETTTSWTQAQKQAHIDKAEKIIATCDIVCKNAIAQARKVKAESMQSANWELEILGAKVRGLGKVKRHYVIDGNVLLLERAGVFNGIEKLDLSKYNENDIVAHCLSAFEKAGFQKTDGVVRSDIHVIKTLLRTK